ncbi:GNAT family N-acetyltransferase [Loigolactobacillus binensis]|uniref:GNAT family N-acetyltransferase n=1 Tax=Loigolactobacillus binensis TaxID=2559922 RepID=A0ABW3EFT6_9LACO|nr:GNAT family N-acetyltransferase [Loigolactobacillus binensis]
MKFTFEPGRYYYNDADDRLVAEVTFQSLHAGTVLAVDHTFVREDHRGQGIASQLITTMITYAQEQQAKILPLCPYAKRFFANKPEYTALLTSKG